MCRFKLFVNVSFFSLARAGRKSEPACQKYQTKSCYFYFFLLHWLPIQIKLECLSSTSFFFKVNLNICWIHLVKLFWSKITYSFWGQGKITAPLSANVNVLSAFCHSQPAGTTLTSYWGGGKRKVEQLIYPYPSFCELGKTSCGKIVQLTQKNEYIYSKKVFWDRLLIGPGAYSSYNGSSLVALLGLALASSSILDWPKILARYRH